MSPVLGCKIEHKGVTMAIIWGLDEEDGFLIDGDGEGDGDGLSVPLQGPPPPPLVSNRRQP